MVAPDCCPTVLGSNPASPQPTADCQSPDGLPPGMNCWFAKKYKENKIYFLSPSPFLTWRCEVRANPTPT
jgi:hypothetical protein